MTETRSIVEHNIRSWNARDRSAWRRDISDDCELTGPGALAGRGREGMEMFYSTWTYAFPDNQITAHVIVTEGDNAVLEGTFEGTHTGPLQVPPETLPASGKRIKVPFVSVSTIKGGKVTSVHLFFDQVELLTQLGLMPDLLRDLAVSRADAGTPRRLTPRHR